MEKLQGGSPPERTYLSTSVWGLTGSGKTTYALTHPWPLFFVNCDRSPKHLFGLLPPECDIYYEDTVLKPGEAPNQANAVGILQRFDELVTEALKVSQGTFIIDNGWAFWDIVKGATLQPGETDKRAWEVPNNRFRQILLTLEAAPLHFVITHPATHPWVSMSKESDKLKAEAFKHLEGHITSEVYMFEPGREETLDPVAVKALAKGAPAIQTTGHWAHIWRNKLNNDTVGMVLPSPSFSQVYWYTTGQQWEGPTWSP